MADNRMKDAEQLFTEIFSASMSKLSAVYNFRWMGQLGLPQAKRDAEWQHKRSASNLAYAKEHANLFNVDREVLIAAGIFDKLAQDMTEKAVANYEAALDAASLVFVHSVVDGAALDYCRVCALIAPEDWLPYVDKKRLALADIKGKSFEKLLDETISVHLGNIERDSLTQKLDLLFALCKLPAKYQPMKDYRYDRDRIVALDKLRHDYVHGDGPTRRLPQGDDDIFFFRRPHISCWRL